MGVQHREDRRHPPTQPVDDTPVLPEWDRGEFLETRKSLIAGQHDLAKSFDQALLTLSGGALGVSFAFVQQFVPQPVYTLLLLFAWVAFAVALLVTLASFLVGMHAFEREITLLDRAYQGDLTAQADRRWLVGLAKICNWAAVLSFIAGVLLLIVFGFLNYP